MRRCRDCTIVALINRREPVAAFMKSATCKSIPFMVVCAERAASPAAAHRSSWLRRYRNWRAVGIGTRRVRQTRTRVEDPAGGSFVAWAPRVGGPTAGDWRGPVGTW